MHRPEGRSTSRSRQILWVLAVALAGFVAYQVLINVFGMWLSEGRPRRVSVEELEDIAGVSLPPGSDLVNSQYRKGLRHRSLFAEIALGERDLETLAKSMVPGVELQFSDEHITDLLTRIHDSAPSWWPRLEDVSLAAEEVQVSEDLGHPPRRLVFAVARRAEPNTHVYFYWSETQ